jgi:hypothetical protein
MWIRRLSEAALAACVALTAVDAAAVPPAGATATDDPMEQFRERFKQGMDRYKAGAPAEATGYWEPIYRELGEQRGYRLAYNLGVAYAELGDATRAAERLQSFLSEVDARRARGETLATIVTKEEADAQQRIAGLIASKGRLHVHAGSPPRAAQVDAGEPRLAGFVAWVSPGEHVVTFAPGSAEQETKTLSVQAGELVEVAPATPVTPAAPTASPLSPPQPASSPSPSTMTRRETDHPFSPALVITAGAVTLGVGIAAIPLHLHASSLYDQYAPEPSRTPSNAQSFYDARTLAYVTTGSAIGLAAVTAGLAAWYFLGTSTREVVVTPGGIAGRF